MNQKTMNYKGYTASIDYSDEEGCLIEKLLALDTSYSSGGPRFRKLMKLSKR
jgi:predicted HicB family RNase H-like nuclease